MTWFDGNSTDGTSDGFTPPEVQFEQAKAPFVLLWVFLDGVSKHCARHYVFVFD
jgi:hypothetical protein